MHQSKNELAHSIAISLRPKMIVLPWLVYASVITIYGAFNLADILTGLLFFISVYGVVTIMNDFSDIHIDIVNKRNIPLAKGLVSKKELSLTAIILTIVALTTAMLLGAITVLLLVVYLALGYIYSYKPFSLKDNGWYGIVLLSICYAVLPWVLALGVGNIQVNTTFYFLASGTFLISIATLPLKDFKDLKGDKKHKKNTVLLKYGSDYVKKVLVLGTVAAYVALAIAVYNINAYITAAVAMLGLVIAIYMQSSLNINSKVQRKQLGTINRSVYYLLVVLAMWIVNFM